VRETLDEFEKIDENEEISPRRPTPHDEFQPGRKVGFGSWVMSCLIALIVVIVIAIAIPSRYGTRRTAWASRAKGTLRSIGSSQLAYQGTNNEKSYGSFSALKGDLYIAEDYNLGNMIENFSMTWEVSGTLSTVEGDVPLGIMDKFIIVAYPRDLRPGYLSTFAVTEDQVVRVYNPSNDNEFYNVYSWDPIL